MSDAGEKFDIWAVVEVMGHQRYAGRVTEQVIGGASFIRVDVPDIPPVNGSGARAAFTKILGASSIFAITPCTEAVATRAAAQSYGSGLHVVGMGQPSLPSYLDKDDDFEAEE